MSDTPAVVQFVDDILAVVRRYVEARSLSNAETIGALHLIIADIIQGIDEE